MKLRFNTANILIASWLIIYLLHVAVARTLAWVHSFIHLAYDLHKHTYGCASLLISNVDHFYLFSRPFCFHHPYVQFDGSICSFVIIVCVTVLHNIRTSHAFGLDRDRGRGREKESGKQIRVMQCGVVYLFRLYLYIIDFSWCNLTIHSSFHRIFSLP